MSPHDPSVRDFLDRSMVARLATLSPKGAPHLTPLWFTRHEGRIWMNTGAGSPAARNVAADPSVVLLFDAERGPGSSGSLRIRGRAVLRRDGPVIRRTLLRSALKYQLSPGGLKDLLAHPRTLGARVRYYAERRDTATVIEILPESAEFLPHHPSRRT